MSVFPATWPDEALRHIDAKITFFHKLILLIYLQHCPQWPNRPRYIKGKAIMV